MAAWWRRWPGLEVRPAAPATHEEFCRAHSRDYVDDVFAKRVANGFGTHSDEVNASLPFTSGAMLTAARWALAEGGAVAAPVSGFHHAHWQSGEGYCTFNGLMVTALRAARRERPGSTGRHPRPTTSTTATARHDILAHAARLGPGCSISAGRRGLRPREQADAFLRQLPRTC